MRISPLGTTAAVATLVLALAACSSDSDADAGEEATPTLGTTSSAPPTPAESVETSASEPADDAIPTSYPEVGLEFTSLPEADGPAAAALATYVEFERGMRQLGRTAESNELLAETASPAFQPTIDSTLAYLRDNDIRYQGTTKVAVELGGASKRVATLDVCADASGLELVTAGKPGPVQGPQQVEIRVVLNNSDGARWSVSQYLEGDAC